MKNLLLSLIFLFAFAESAQAEYVGCVELGDTIPLRVQWKDTTGAEVTATSRGAVVVTETHSTDTTFGDGDFTNIASKAGWDFVLLTVGAGDAPGLWSIRFDGTIDGISGLPGIDTFDVKSDVSECGAATADIVDDVWDESLTGATHNVPTSSGRRLRSLGDVVDGEVDDASATTISFITDLTGLHDDHYAHQSINFISGNLTGMSKVISAYNASTKLITVESSFPEAPADGDEFTVPPTHVHPIIEIVDQVWDEVLSKSTHNVGQSSGKRLRQLATLISADASINDASPTDTSFITTFTSTVDDLYVDQVLVIVDDTDLIGQSRVVSAYDGTTKRVTVDEAFSQVPLNGSDIIIFSPHVHPVTQIADAVLDEPIEGVYSMREALCIISGVIAGKLSSSGGTASFRGLEDTEDRSVVTFAAGGNRSTITFDLTGCQ